MSKLQIPACLGGGPSACADHAGQPCDSSMAVFADLDLRAGSDLKALRGLVENAAHRESPWLRGPPCCPASPSPDCRATFWKDSARPGLRVSGMSLEADARRGVVWIPNAGNSKALGSCYPVWLLLSCTLRKLRPGEGGFA